MSTVLTNGIIIPDNGSRNWGGDLANNWNIIDLNVGYMTDVKNRVTTLENGVAENTANIQINTSNISALQTSKQDSLSEQQIANIAAVTNKANDADVVHKSGDETISGVKNFNDVVLGEQSGLIRIGNNGKGALFCNFAYDGRIYNNSSQFVPATTNVYSLGSPTLKWRTINGINPGSLSLPNVAEHVDVTSQVVNNDGIYRFTNNLYDGWLVVTAFADNLQIANQGFECRVVRSADNALTAYIALRTNETASMRFANFTNFAYVKLFKCLGAV